MKKLLALSLAIMAIFAFSNSIYAQKIGPKIGYNLSTIAASGDLVIGDQSVPSAALGGTSNMTYGLFLKSNLVPLLLDLQFEVNYDPRGTKLDYSDANLQGFSGTVNMEYNYVTIPALLKAKVLFLYFEAGPYASILLDAKDKFAAEINGEQRKTEEDVKDQLNSTDFGLMGGAGLQLGFGPLYLMGGARYTMGLSEIYKDDYYLKTDDISFKHHVWTFYAGVGIGF